jgi:DNA ligase N terminus
LRTQVPAPWRPADILLVRLAGARTGRRPTGKESRVRYQIVAEAYRDLEAATARLALIDRLASLVRQTPTELLPTVALLCQGQIAPDFAGVELGVNERLAARAVATATGVPPEQVLALARETGDLGLAAERLLQELDPDRPATLEVRTVFEGLHQVAAAEGTGSQGRKLAGLGSLLQQATPLGPATWCAPAPAACAWASAPPPSWTRSPRSTPAAARPARCWSGPTTSARTWAWSPPP